MSDALVGETLEIVFAMSRVSGHVLIASTTLSLDVVSFVEVRNTETASLLHVIQI